MSTKRTEAKRAKEIEAVIHRMTFEYQEEERQRIKKKKLFMNGLIFASVVLVLIVFALLIFGGSDDHNHESVANDFEGGQATEFGAAPSSNMNEEFREVRMDNGSTIMSNVANAGEDAEEMTNVLVGMFTLLVVVFVMIGVVKQLSDILW